MDIMMFLAISPDVDNPDEQSGGEETSATASSLQGTPDAGAVMGQKRTRTGAPLPGRGASSAAAAAALPASIGAPSFSIDLPDAPTNEVRKGPLTEAPLALPKTALKIAMLLIEHQ